MYWDLILILHHFNFNQTYALLSLINCCSKIPKTINTSPINVDKCISSPTANLMKNKAIKGDKYIRLLTLAVLTEFVNASNQITKVRLI